MLLFADFLVEEDLQIFYEFLNILPVPLVREKFDHNLIMVSIPFVLEDLELAECNRKHRVLGPVEWNIEIRILQNIFRHLKARETLADILNLKIDLRVLHQIVLALLQS